MMNLLDLIVIGSGPAGEMAAVEAGFLGKRVALIEREPVLGGAAANTGTIPSKTLRETALFLAGAKQRSLYGVDVRLKNDPQMPCDFLYRERHVAEQEREKIRVRLAQANVEVFTGNAVLESAHAVVIDGKESLTGDVIFIATGSRPFRSPVFPKQSRRFLDSNTILDLEALPTSMTVVGAGVIGCEYACIFASLGVDITLVHSQDKLLPFLDGEIQVLLESAIVSAGIQFLKNERVVSCTETALNAEVTLSSGDCVKAGTVLIATGRASNTDGLGLENAGVLCGERGLIKVDAHYQTNIPNIYAAGDVIGFPALASTSIAQARIAMEHAFRPADEERPSPVLPYGIYTIPECAMVGETEEQVRLRGVEFVTGKGRYADNARGLIIGEAFGLLKMIFEKSTRRLLGVHIIGEQATEIIHAGVIAMATNATADEFMRTSFNYPTLSELYKHAAYDAFGKPAVE